MNYRWLLEEALSRLRDRLGEMDVEVEWEPGLDSRYQPDAVVDLRWEGGKARLVVEVKAYPHPNALQMAAEQIKAVARKREIPILVAPYLDPSKRKSLRESGVGFLDASGNAFLRSKGLLLFTENDKNPFRPAKRKTPLFTDKGALILKKLLESRHRSWKVRELAEESGASLGMTSKVLNALREAGYSSSAVDDGFRLIRIEDLLSEWVEFYRFERRNVSRGYFFPAPSPAKVMAGFHKAAGKKGLGPYAFTLHAAGRIIDPFIEGVDVNHVYVSGDIALWASKLDLIEAREPNLILVQPYYKTAVFADSRKAKGGVILVSALQLFLDFFHFPLRGREGAEHLFERCLGKQLGIERFF
ncbi:MAG: hypothetical protein ACYS47_15415 [Planctomycetota bacterium]